ncbi:MAG: DegV family protein [Anaerolineales bacterium]|jgi:DegV family protein with EDD domain
MVRIVTDATVRFTNPDFTKKRNIAVSPLTVICGSKRVQDDPAIDLADVRPVLESCADSLSIEAPSVEDFAQVFERLSTETHQILSIHTSSALTQSYQHALQASQLYRGRMDIQVIDSQSVSIGLGFLVEASARAAERGESLDTIVRMVRGMISRLYMVMFLDDLTFLEHNQLVTRSQAILGNMLGIIPFLTMEDGQLIPMEKVRNRMRAVEKLVEFVCEFSGLEQLGLMQGQIRPTEDTLLIQERLHTLFPTTPISRVCYGPSLSAFVGFDSIGAVVLEAQGESL